MRLKVGMRVITAGLGIRVGMSMAFGLIWTSAVLGDNDDGVIFAPAVNYAVADSPRSVAIADLNGDQILDLAVANNFSDNVSVLRGVGDGTFFAAAFFAVGESPSSVAIGDLNGDQLPDLAVANEGTHTQVYSISVLLGVGFGTFGAPADYLAGSGPSSVAIGDLNGDQVSDLAVANENSDNLSVLLGVGDGSFSPPVNYAAVDFTASVAIGDLNGDLIPDLAVPNAGVDGGSNVSVLLGVGDGTFAPAVNYPAAVQPCFIAIGDLNGDLAPDLVVVHQFYDNISVMLGVGNGTFVPAVRYNVDERPKSVAIGDLDGDEVPDLAVANTFGHNVSVLLGIGDGTFAAAVQFATGNGAWSVAIGDLDGDQFPDLAVANSVGDNVSVLLNRSGGACCLGTACSIANRLGCQDSGGAFLGQNTTCEPDADGDGVRDGCDVCDGGDDNDDRDGDGVPDDCDACNNNLPNSCDFVSPILATAPHDILKNRYVSIDPRGEGAFNLGDVPFDIRVRLSNTKVCGVTAIGEWWWANEPDVSCISIVGPTQPATPPDWSACPTLHLTGCPIIPTSTYEIAAVVDGRQAGPPLVGDTQARPDDNKWWGDAVGMFTGASWTGPQGVTNFDDVNAALLTFKDPGAVNATHVSITDIHPNRPDLGGSSVHPNKLVSIDDVFSFLKAFQGEQYPGSALNGCTDP